MSRDEIAELVRSLGDLFATVRATHHENKAEIYRQLGVGLTYQPDEQIVIAETNPKLLWGKDRVGGGT